MEFIGVSYLHPSQMFEGKARRLFLNKGTIKGTMTLRIMTLCTMKLGLA